VPDYRITNFNNEVLNYYKVTLNILFDYADCGSNPGDSTMVPIIAMFKSNNADDCGPE